MLETMISDHPDAEVMVYNGTEIEGTHNPSYRAKFTLIEKRKICESEKNIFSYTGKRVVTR